MNSDIQIDVMELVTLIGQKEIEIRLLRQQIVGLQQRLAEGELQKIANKIEATKNEKTE